MYIVLIITVLVRVVGVEEKKIYTLVVVFVVGNVAVVTVVEHVVAGTDVVVVACVGSVHEISSSAEEFVVQLAELRRRSLVEENDDFTPVKMY